MNRYKDIYRVESTRLPDRNYATNGWYFVTVCTRDRLCWFGEVIDGAMRLSVVGEMAKACWLEIPQHSVANVSLDAWVVMPNHIHGIITIDNPKPPPECRDVARNVSPGNVSDNPMSNISPKSGSLGAIVRSFKSAVTRQCRQGGVSSFAWQPRFYDHVIRQDGSLERIRQYILENPGKWQEDKENPVNLWM